MYKITKIISNSIIKLIAHDNLIENIELKNINYLINLDLILETLLHLVEMPWLLFQILLQQYLLQVHL